MLPQFYLDGCQELFLDFSVAFMPTQVDLCPKDIFVLDFINLKVHNPVLEIPEAISASESDYNLIVDFVESNKSKQIIHFILNLGYVGRAF